MPYRTLCQQPGCPRTLESGLYCDVHRKQPARASGKRYRNARWYATRKRIFHRDGYKCQACERLMGVDSPHCDHITPVAQGGTDDEDNLQTLCPECHAIKTARERAEL